MERDIVFSGVHLGEHGFDAENIKNEIYERCIKPGYNFVTIRPNKTEVPQQTYIDWAQYLTDNKIYFVFLYTLQNAPGDKESHLTFDTVKRIKEIAGEYFIGDMIGETGSDYACKLAGYFSKTGKSGEGRKGINVSFDHPDMKAAAENYVKSVSELIEIDRELEVPAVISVEATALNKYNAEAGVDFPMLELMCGNPEILVPSLRGVARATRAKLWGTYVAHEWYGGMRHDDILKRKRLELAYKYAYMSGSNAFCLESGDELITAYDQRFEADSEICQDYRNVLTYISDYIKKDSRPVGGPKVKLAFVSGLYDSWGGWGGSAAWSQVGREEWGYNEAEFSWRMLEELGTKRQWYDIANFGDEDLSSAPAYGMYDVIPIEAPVDVLCQYDYLIFMGWNSMTDENMDKLIEYTKNGGHLLMTAAHMNCRTQRKGDYIPPSADKLKALFGVEFTGEIISVNDGVKFSYDAVTPGAMYPGSRTFRGDPIYSAGYAQYAIFKPAGGTVSAFLSNSFVEKSEMPPAVIENKIENGVATLVTSINYPGNPAITPLYRAIMREFVTMSARACDIKVSGSDRVRYAVYEGNKMYLLNTDYDMSASVKIAYNGKEQIVTLDSLELKTIVL